MPCPSVVRPARACSMNSLTLAFLFAAALLSATELRAQAPASATPSFSQTFGSVFLNPAFRPRYPDSTHWLDGGASYTLFEPSNSSPQQLDLVAYDTASGQRRVLIPAAQLIPAGTLAPLAIDDYAWSPDRKQILLFANTRKVWRLNTRGDYWLLDLATRSLVKLGGDAPEASLMFAKFSPDSRSVGYVRAGNLYVQDLASKSIRQLTTDASDDIINGTTDWVTEEEIDLRDAFRWSPDSASILYLQTDQSHVGVYTLINDTATLYPTIFRYHYPQAGTTNSSVRLGVLPAAGGATTWLQLPGDPRQHYIPRFDWIGDSNEITIEYLNRPQNLNQVYVATAQTGAVRLLFEDKDAAWIDYVDELNWLPSGNNPSGPKHDLVWLSERDGWRHAYLIPRDTGQPRLLTNFSADVISITRVDASSGFLYFLASPGDPIRAYLYRARLDGTGTPERVTPAAQSGTHDYDISPDGHFAIHTWSSASMPPRFDLISLPTHTVARPIVDNDDLLARLNQQHLAQFPEFTETPIGGGITLSTSITRPANFDPAKKYPVFTYVYGEPADAIVHDSWSVVGNLGSAIFASRGYIVVSFDNQGTPAPRGRAWRKAGYGAIGVLSTQQQAAAIRAFAASHPYVDASRMAIWGASGGGTNTLNMMFRNPGLYTTGISLAPVPDQAHYDTIYQERYMGIPADNPTGYHDAAAINFAQGLTGSLLLVHGSGDDNVHFQGSELLVNRLIELGKPFEFMDYPNRTHALSEGRGTTLHLFTLMDRFLEDHVPAGPR